MLSQDGLGVLGWALVQFTANARNIPLPELLAALQGLDAEGVVTYCRALSGQQLAQQSTQHNPLGLAYDRWQVAGEARGVSAGAGPPPPMRGQAARS